MDEQERGLARLRDLSDYKVADGDPDPRGWNVVTRDGIHIGRVDDLIVDPESERACYLDVRLDQPAATERHVLVPTDAVHLGRDEQHQNQVEVAATMEYFAGATPYTGLPLTPAQESEYGNCPPVPGANTPRPPTRVRRGHLPS